MGRITLDKVSKSFGEVEVIPPLGPDHRGRRIYRVRRPVGLRQIHPAATDRGA